MESFKQKALGRYSAHAFAFVQPSSFSFFSFFSFLLSRFESCQLSFCKLRTDASGRALSRSSLAGRRGIGLDRVLVIPGQNVGRRVSFVQTQIVQWFVPCRTSKLPRGSSPVRSFDLRSSSANYRIIIRADRFPRDDRATPKGNSSRIQLEDKQK